VADDGVKIKKRKRGGSKKIRVSKKARQDRYPVVDLFDLISHHTSPSTSPDFFIFLTSTHYSSSDGMASVYESEKDHDNHSRGKR